MTLHRFFLWVAGFVVVSAGAFPSTGVAEGARSKPQKLGAWDDWAAYTEIEKGKRICYMYAAPQKSTGNYKKRGNVFMMITHRPSMKSFNVVMFEAGYAFGKHAQVQALIGEETFSLFTEGEQAWAADSRTDHQLTQLMTRQYDMTFTGRSARGTATKDVFSLKGSSQAYKAINRACRYKG